MQVDGVELHQVRLMGAIVEVTEHSTNTIFRIEDGTGRIDVKVFNDNDETVAQVCAYSVLRTACWRKVLCRVLHQSS
jgi:RecJ-like exonuclease